MMEIDGVKKVKGLNQKDLIAKAKKRFLEGQTNYNSKNSDFDKLNALLNIKKSLQYAMSAIRISSVLNKKVDLSHKSEVQVAIELSQYIFKFMIGKFRDLKNRFDSMQFTLTTSQNGTGLDVQKYVPGISDENNYQEYEIENGIVIDDSLNTILAVIESYMHFHKDQDAMIKEFEENIKKLH